MREGEAATTEATLVSCKKHEGEFRVESILNDGECEVAIFSGPNAVERAIVFATTAGLTLGKTW
jgi:hypothetical protein